jgi:hypothetical protein
MSAKSSGLDFISQRLLPKKIGIGGSDCLEDAEVFYCFLPKTGAQTKLTGDTKGQELEKHERERAGSFGLQFSGLLPFDCKSCNNFTSTSLK